MSGAEHRREALRLLDEAEDVGGTAGGRFLVAVAQVHATLALSANDSDPAAEGATR